eukprot:9285509-Lingulodinium_polyedra.AAC.1
MLYPSGVLNLAMNHRILAALRSAALPQDNHGVLAREFEDLVMVNTAALGGYAHRLRVIVAQSAH